MFLLQFGLLECCTMLIFVVILCVVVLKMHVVCFGQFRRKNWLKLLDVNIFMG